MKDKEIFMAFDNNIINWLTEHNNPAIEYRTKVELLNEKANNSKVFDWVNGFLPVDWKNKKGLWLAACRTINNFYMFYWCFLCFFRIYFYLHRSVFKNPIEVIYPDILIPFLNSC